MKRSVWLILLMALLLTGCASVPTFETIGNVYTPENTPEPCAYTLTLPENASVQTIQGDTGRIYFCDGYEILVETLAAGNLDGTVRTLSGFGLRDLTVMETEEKGYRCFECVWTSAGEGGFQTARTKILDDGLWHYCLTVMAPAEMVSSLQEDWKSLFESFALAQS